jgi:hypothetical protein
MAPLAIAIGGALIICMIVAGLLLAHKYDSEEGWSEDGASDTAGRTDSGEPDSDVLREWHPSSVHVSDDDESSEVPKGD